MKISNSKLLPLVFLPFFVASCNHAPQPIEFGHDACNLCERPIDNPEYAALAISIDGDQFNYDSIECLVQHIGQANVEMAVVKVADYQHPGFMLNAHESHFKIQTSTSDSEVAQLAALRHNRSNSLCWKELQSQWLERSQYISQNADAVDYRAHSYR